MCRRIRNWTEIWKKMREKLWSPDVTLSVIENVLLLFSESEHS